MWNYDYQVRSEAVGAAFYESRHYGRVEAVRFSTNSLQCEQWAGCILQACMVLRLEAEEVTQYTDDLDADAKRDLLAALLQSVDEVLLFFRTVSRSWLL